jgi:hypothetical protein
MKSRFFLATVIALAAAACQPEAKPVEPTLEELGQDDPGAPFVPAAVGPARTYEAMSKTAMSFTPGKLTITPTPQVGPNSPEGAIFAFENGIKYEGTLMPGGAEMGETPYDFASVFPATSGPFDVAKVVMYSIDAETIPEKTPNGGLCDDALAFAIYTQADTITIAAFNGDQWPPKDETSLCGTFSYTLVK